MGDGRTPGRQDGWMLSRLTGLLILTRVPQASRRLGVLASLFLLLIPALASAQRIERKPAYPGQWLTSYIPFVATLPNDGPSIEFRARHWQMADYEDRVTHNIAWIGRAAWSPWGGSWLGSIGLSAPQLAPGWRLAGEVQAGRANRYGFYGLGNVTDVNTDLDEADKYLYRVRRNLYAANLDLTRQLAGPVGISLMLQGANADFEAIGPSVFESQFGESLNQWEGSGRLALVLDLRDTEYDTRKGVLADVGFQLGYGDGDDYRRWYGELRGWVPPTPTTVIAARAFASDLSGTPTLYAREVIPAWEQPFSVLGGEESQRALSYGRLTGTGVLGANIEVRQMIYGRQDLGGVGLVAFVDAGRAFEGEKLSLTFDDWTVGYGGGLVVKVLRGNIFVLTAGFSGDEHHIGFRTGWMF
jgi:hypothetical protein